MCGRFYVPTEDMSDELLQILNRAESRLQAADPAFRLPRGEVRPGDWAAVVSMNRAGQPSSFAMKWGYHMQGPGSHGNTADKGKKLLINARCETAAQKPTFRDGMVNRRCLIPAGAYFEWDHRKKPLEKYRFFLPDGPLMWLAGIYRFEPDSRYPVFTVLTRPAAANIAPLHDRMPVIVPPEMHARWLDRSLSPTPVLDAAMTEVIFRRA